MKRRHFIGMAAAGAASLVLPARARVHEPFALTTLAHPRLLDIVRDERVVRDLGRRYREIAPADDNVDVLAQAIVAEPHATFPASLRECVDDQVQRDFADGRTVTLNGWILSVTEARQCALYSLLQT